MCGRTASTLNKESISHATAYKDRANGQPLTPQWLEDKCGQTYEAHFNQTSGNCLPVLISNKFVGKHDSEAEARVLCPMRWGLMPHWIKSDNSAPIQPINCRFETIGQKKTFSSSLKNGRRCVAVVDGFFEWKTNEDFTKDPYFLYFPQKYVDYKSGDYSWLKDQSKLISDGLWRGPRLLTIARLFNQSPETGFSFTVITVPSHPSLEWLHNRMPAILDSEDSVRDWLDFNNVSADEAVKLLTPFGGLEYHKVSRLVSNARNNSYENLLPTNVKPKQKTIDQWLKRGNKKLIDEEIKKEEDNEVSAAKRNKQ